MKKLKGKIVNLFNKIFKKEDKRLNSCYWIGFLIIYLELVYRIFVIGNLATWNALFVILFSIPWIVLFSYLTCLFNEKANKVITIIISSLLILVSLAQIVYFNFYGSIFSVFSITAGGAGQVAQFWVSILEVILRIWYIFLIELVPFILFLIFNKKIFKFPKIKLKKFLILLGLLILSGVGIFVSIKENKGTNSLQKLLFSTHAPLITIEKTGLMTMEAIDLYRYAFGFEEEIVEEETGPIVIDETKEYNVLESINFEELINNSSGTINNMHKYFSTVEPTEKNKYTGLFKGKNLIFITAEAFDTIAVDPELTPTLYNIANSSFIFTNFYQPLYTVSTYDGEYLNLTSLIPKEGVWSFKVSASNSQPFGFGNIFKKEGYTTYGFHDHYYKYYSRNKSHPNIGLNWVACSNGLEKKMNCKHWPNSDYEMMQVTPEYYINNEPFATYYLSVSGHVNYNFSGNAMASRNKKYVKNLKYSESVKAYLACQMEFDKGMSELIRQLQEADKLDDTLIVIVADHYPYGLSKTQINEKATINRNDKFEVFHSTLIMYNPSIEKTVIDKTISSIDIIPTLYNMYGLDFDSRLFMGRDIFSDQESIVILSDRSWITSKGRYNSVNGKFYPTTDEQLPEDYVANITNIVNKRVSMSAAILDNNYYANLGL